jgi:topoisomerase-4 subunit A
VVLLNGASGIAVGMATEIPPHNLREVAEAAKLLIRKPEATLEEVLAVLPGPDFPGGGQLISTPADIRDAYANGRGSLRMRARWSIEELARGQWRVIINELPHGVSVRRCCRKSKA